MIVWLTVLCTSCAAVSNWRFILASSSSSMLRLTSAFTSEHSAAPCRANARRCAPRAAVAGADHDQRDRADQRELVKPKVDHGRTHPIRAARAPQGRHCPRQSRIGGGRWVELAFRRAVSVRHPGAVQPSSRLRLGVHVDRVRVEQASGCWPVAGMAARPSRSPVVNEALDRAAGSGSADVAEGLVPNTSTTMTSTINQCQMLKDFHVVLPVFNAANFRDAGSISKFWTQRGVRESGVTESWCSLTRQRRKCTAVAPGYGEHRGTPESSSLEPCPGGQHLQDFAPAQTPRAQWAAMTCRCMWKTSCPPSRPVLTTWPG